MLGRKGETEERQKKKVKAGEEVQSDESKTFAFLERHQCGHKVVWRQRVREQVLRPDIGKEKRNKTNTKKRERGKYGKSGKMSED